MRSIFCVFALLILFSTLSKGYTITFEDAKDLHHRMYTAVGSQDYEKAVRLFKELDDVTREKPEIRRFFPVFRDTVPFTEIIQSRQKLGRIAPEVHHKIAVFLISGCEVDDFMGKDVQLHSILSPEDRAKVNDALQVFRLYVEVLSKGQWTVDFEYIPLNSVMTHVCQLPGLSNGPMPDIHSLNPFPQSEIYQTLTEVDSLFFIWNDKGIDIRRSYGGMQPVPLVPYQMEGHPRGYVRVYTDMAFGFVFLHEWWHAIEDMYRIHPYHGYQPQSREKFLNQLL